MVTFGCSLPQSQSGKGTARNALPAVSPRSVPSTGKGSMRPGACLPTRTLNPVQALTSPAAPTPMNGVVEAVDLLHDEEFALPGPLRPPDWRRALPSPRRRTGPGEGSESSLSFKVIVIFADTSSGKTDPAKIYFAEDSAE